MEFRVGRFALLLSAFLLALLGSSCSCGISAERYLAQGGRVSATQVKQAGSELQFKEMKSQEDDLVLKKGYSYLYFDESAQSFRFWHSFCPFPWEFLFNHGEEYSPLAEKLKQDLENQGVRMVSLSKR